MAADELARATHQAKTNAELAALKDGQNERLEAELQTAQEQLLDFEEQLMFKDEELKIASECATDAAAEHERAIEEKDEEIISMLSKMEEATLSASSDSSEVDALQSQFAMEKQQVRTHCTLHVAVAITCARACVCIVHRTVYTGKPSFPRSRCASS